MDVHIDRPSEVSNLRHYCRNPKCRSKLLAPVGNLREAFCGRGCYGAFYRHHCLVCQEPMERKTGRQLICGRRRCRSGLRGGLDLGRYHPSSSVVSPTEKPIKPGTFLPVKTTRANIELCWLGRRGNPIRLDKGVRELIVAPRREHSRKPDEVFERIERYCAGPYLDLFARQRRPGWTVWGDQVDKFSGEAA